MRKNFKSQPCDLRIHLTRTKNDSQVLELELVAKAPDLILFPVPLNLALDTDRFYISCGDWYAAIQLSRSQAYRAIELCGTSRERDIIWGAIEQVINGGVK